MKAPPPPRALVPVLAASAGVVVAHAVDYAILYPPSNQRAAHLAVTGHGYWPLAVAIALGAAALSILLAAGRGASRRDGAPGNARWLNAGSLLAIQAVAFAALETGERALAGLPPSVLLHSPDIWIGLLLQVPVALVAARLLGAVEETAHRIAEALRQTLPRHRRRAASWRPASLATPRVALLATPALPRGPPVAACA